MGHIHPTIALSIRVSKLSNLELEGIIFAMNEINMHSRYQYSTDHQVTYHILVSLLAPPDRDQMMMGERTVEVNWLMIRDYRIFY